MSNVRQMMKDKGRKVDMKALKEAKRAKLAMLAKENDIKERKLQKEREREMFNNMQPPPPPQRVMGPPPTKRSLPANFFDQTDNNKMPPPPPSIKVSSIPSIDSKLPNDFFDSDTQEGNGGDDDNTENKDSNNGGFGGLVGYDSNDDSDASEGEEAIVEANVVIEASSSSGSSHTSSALPEGFFDDADADMRARGVVPQVVATAQKDIEIDEFMAFAEKVGEASAQTDELSSEVALETARLSSVEQALYMNRVAKLMQKVDKQGTTSKEKAMTTSTQKSINGISSNGITSSSSRNSNKDDDTALVDTIELNVDQSDESQKVLQDVQMMVKGRKKKKRAAQLAANECDFVPLDPTNWRAKTF